MWLGHAEAPGHWRDTHFRVEGPVVAQMQAAFMDNWVKTHQVVLHGADYFPPLNNRGPLAAQMFKSSPREGSESVRLMYLLAFAAARESILISSAYFVPDQLAVDALVAARRRGVRVEVIVPGKHIDLEVVRRASRARWGDLLRAGVEIHEYQPTMYHCKIIVVDGRWVSVGSTNFDNRSFRLNDEANLNLYDGEFAAKMTRIFEADKAKSHRITLAEWRRRPLAEKAVEHLASLLRSQF